ncbi:nucleotidyl transferase AbiEii/AbiGii toxin family protein [Silvimonas sp. JCM 19000]
MRRITAGIKAEIIDATSAGAAGNLSEAAIEKDQHVTDVLRALATLCQSDIVHRQVFDKTMPATQEIMTRLIFAGGTCLSKAHRLIERMSEDIDIKIVLDPVPAGYALAKGKSDRARLTALQRKVEHLLHELGFSFVAAKGNPLTRDKHRYYCLRVAYHAEFHNISRALRPELRLELIHRPPLLPADAQAIGYLLDSQINRPNPAQFPMACISIAETLAEKVLSLLRRCAWYWDGYQRGEFDTALVRHIYDVSQIVQQRPDMMAVARHIFGGIVSKDVEEFRGQHPEFDATPYEVLRRTLERAAIDTGLRENYENRLKPLLFAANRPEFDVYFADFLDVATRLLDHADPLPQAA